MSSKDFLSKLIIHSKYARYLEDKKRRETWEEIVTRNMNMHIKKFPGLEEEIRSNYQYVYDRRVVPSMRSLQFAGKPVEINPARQYNCSAVAITYPDVFSEIMFLLLSGCGVGVSVQRHHIEQLPIVRGPLKRTRRYLVSDSIEGWGDAVKVLFNAYFYNKSNPEFDFRDIREKGARLLTSGGRAPGPQPLKDCVHNLRKVLDTVESGEKLTPIQAHDIVCYIADSVLSGGIRRAAVISLFSLEDDEMLHSKSGQWWVNNPQRGRANNSAVLLRHRVKREDFDILWEKIKNSKSGEPAFIMSNDAELLTNPCGEVSLRSNQFCNLCEINFSKIESQQDLNDCSVAAAFIGTIQSSYTDFHYLGDDWKRTTEKDALLGISITGLASTKIYTLNFKEAAKLTKEENKRVAKLVNVNPAARLTTVKPSGTSSIVLGTSSGIHAWHSEYYIRRIRVMKNETMYQFLKDKIPQLIEDDNEKPHIGAVIGIPICAQKDVITRQESALDLLERVKYMFNNWIVPGHVKGNNKNNVSVTVTVKEHEWDLVKNWLWENRNNYTGISILPEDNSTYSQMPFETISKEKYEELSKYLTDVNFESIMENEDETKVQDEVACGGGSCELRSV